MLTGKTPVESVDEAFKNMTQGMTAYIRTLGEEGEADYTRGSMWLTTTCVYVHW
jgi:hypothetical protein